MFSLDEAIIHAEDVAEENEKRASWFWGKEGNPNYENCIKCAEEHRQLAEWLKDYKRLLEQEPKWIPVSEKLPEWDIECLVVDDKGEFGVGFYRDDVGAWDSPSWGWLERKDNVDNHDAYYMPCGIGKVVAWMPLPKPYLPDTNFSNVLDLRLWWNSIYKAERGRND